MAYKKNVITAVDLFCGGGGTSTGIAMAAKKLQKTLELVAVNHWDVAIETHSLNHQYAQHLCTSVDNVDPHKLVPSGRLNLLVASPECTHHSNARGGKPMNDQSRSSGWHILRFAEALYIENIIIENVREFQDWAPLDAKGRPMKSKKGHLFQQFISSLRALGYNVDYRVLNCADYGDPTSRERLFIIARRGNKKIVWPEPTHAPATVLAKPSLFETNLKPWRTARECIDWSIQSQSIFYRKRPLAPNTLHRIQAGLKKFNGIDVDLERCIAENLRPFVVVPRNHGDARSVDEPLPALTANGQHFGLVEPYIVAAGGTEGQGRHPHRIDKPMGSVLTNDRWALVDPFVLQTDQTGGGGTKVRTIDSPVPTLVTKANTCVVESFLLPNEGVFRSNQPRSLDRPLNTVTAERGAGHLVEPFILPHPRQNDQPHSVDRPMRTVTASSSDLSLCEPFLIGQQSCAAPRSANEPVPTLATAGAISLTESFLVPNFGEAPGQEPRNQSIDRPMPTVTASKGAGNLVTPHLISQFSENGPRSIDQPLETVTTTSRGIGLTEPFMVSTNHGDGDRRRCSSVNDPMRTVTGTRGEGLIEPFVIEYYGTENMAGVNNPLPTVTAKDRFALVEGQIVERYFLDIRFRMLQPRELARAQGFPESYVFTGNKAQQVKMIGNAVPPNSAMNLVLACLAESADATVVRAA